MSREQRAGRLAPGHKGSVPAVAAPTRCPQLRAGPKNLPGVAQPLPWWHHPEHGHPGHQQCGVHGSGVPHVGDVEGKIWSRAFKPGMRAMHQICQNPCCREAGSVCTCSPALLRVLGSWAEPGLDVGKENRDWSSSGEAKGAPELLKGACSQGARAHRLQACCRGSQSTSPLLNTGRDVQI